MGNEHYINLNRVNLVKNLCQYLIGAILFFISTNDFSIVKFFVGALGYVISYHSVYQFNDLMDYEEDKKDKIRKKIKPLVTGKIKQSTMIAYVFLFSIIGLPICFFVSTVYGILVSSLLFFNFLYSSKITRLKKSKLWLANIFIIELLKYSSGWFALTTSFQSFPSIFMLLLALVYVFSFIYYKKGFLDLRDKNTITVVLVSIVFLLISILIYPFKLSLLLFIPFTLVFLIFERYDSWYKFKMGSRMIQIAFIYFVISLLILSIPAVAELNYLISENINGFKDEIVGALPSELITKIEKINDSVNALDADVLDEYLEDSLER